MSIRDRTKILALTRKACENLNEDNDLKGSFYDFDKLTAEDEKTIAGIKFSDKGGGIYLSFD